MLVRQRFRLAEIMEPLFPSRLPTIKADELGHKAELTSPQASPFIAAQSFEEILEKLPLPLLDEVLSAEEAGAKLREAYRRVSAATDEAPKAPDSTKHPSRIVK